MVPIVAVVIVGAFCGAVLVSAHRFARRRQREGLWNADGPIHPTVPPPGWGFVPGYGARGPTIESEAEEPPREGEGLA